MKARVSQLLGVGHGDIRPSRHRTTAVLAPVLLALAATLIVTSGAPGASAQDSTTSTLPGVGDTIPAPDLELVDDGLTATDGTRRLTVSAVRDLDPSGAKVTVTGRGYDAEKGIYVAFCRAMPHGQTPTPCGGGAAIDGSTGASQWISSNPPPYGRDLAVPYGPEGDFTVELTLAPEVGDQVDCREVQCVVVTRNDHTRTTDHSQDVAVPVGFAGTPFPTTTTTAPEVEVEETDGDGWLLPVAIGGGVAIVLAAGVVIGLRRPS